MAEENIVSIVIEKMDLAKPTVIPIVKMMQDDKVGRKITVGLYENGNSWTPPEGASAQVQYSKPDGTGGLYDSIPGYRDIAWEFEENKLSIFIAPQVTTCPGIVELSVRIIKGEFQFSTFTIKIDVHKTPGINVKSEDFVSVNGLLPSSGWEPNKYLTTDEKGNVVAREAPEGGNGAASEQFLTLDLSGYYDGIIKRIYADGGESNLDVTFDANGNPIKFSNGTEEFEVVWPAEDA